MHELASARPLDLLLGPWRWEPELAAILAAAGLLYGVAWIRLRSRGGAGRAGGRHLAAWLGGLGITALAICSPLGTLAHELFWLHMVQHELLIFVAAPLILAGAAPLLSPAMEIVHAHWARLAGAIETMARPLPALALSTAVLWLWHAPAAYDLALASEPVHHLEHLSFVAAYLIFWRPLMHSGGPLPTLRTAAARALYLLAGGTQAAVLGGVLAFARTAYYPLYTHSANAWGFTPLADQQLGGAIMLLSGAIAYFAAAVIAIPEPAPDAAPLETEHAA